MYSLSPDDLSILIDPLTAALVEKHLGDEPVQLALRWKGDREQGRLICQQIKYLQRSESKLPSYYAARCIIPPLSYEQCSSEAAAGLKKYAGVLCLDLTCGLGVDSFHFSRTFDRVISVERDPVLARLARHNFSLLGAGNIAVENASAEEFLARYGGPAADLIYVDPARRSGGERVFKLEDCSPNVLEMMPLLLTKSQKVLIKLSPLFDIEEALRLFAPHVSKAEIVSVGGEVRELLVELERTPTRAQVVVALGDGRIWRFDPRAIGTDALGFSDDPTGANFLLVPDAAFYKGRLVKPGFAFAPEMPEAFPGRVYRILEAFDYQPKKLKKRLKTESLTRINLLRRDFPYSSEEIKKMLSVQEGGAAWFAFTVTGGRACVFRVTPMGRWGYFCG